MLIRDRSPFWRENWRLDDLLGGAEGRVGGHAQQAHYGRPAEHVAPAVVRLQDVAGRVHADEAGQRRGRVHQACWVEVRRKSWIKMPAKRTKHGAGVVGREVLWVDGHAAVVQAAQRHGGRQEEQRRVVVVHARRQRQADRDAHLRRSLKIYF